MSYTMMYRFTSVVLLGLVWLVIPLGQVSALEYTVQKISNSFCVGDNNPQINNRGQIVYIGCDDYSIGVFLYQGSGEPILIAPLRSGGNRFYPQINDNGWIVWSDYDSDYNDEEIFLYDGVSTRQLTNNDYDDILPQIGNNGWVTWIGYDGNVFLDKGSGEPIRITDGDLGLGDYQLNNNGWVTWWAEEGDDPQGEVYLYDGVSSRKLTDGSYYARNPLINDWGWVVWEGASNYYPYYSEIFLYDGVSTRQLTNNDYDDILPQIGNNGWIAWIGGQLDFDGTRNVFLYRGDGDPTQLTDNSCSPSFYAGQLKINSNGWVLLDCWRHPNNISVYNGNSIVEVPGYYDTFYQNIAINDNGWIVIPEAREGNIFLAIPNSVSPQPVADLSMSVVDSPDPVDVGTDLTYMLVIANNGPNAATGIRLTDTIPATTELVSINAFTGSCSGTGTIVCDIAGLPAGADTAVELVVRPTVAGAITNTVSVTTNESDPDTTNNTFSAVTTVKAVSCPARNVAPYADNSLASGLFEGVVKTVSSDKTEATFDISATDLIDVARIFKHGIGFYISIDSIHIASDAITVQPNMSDPVGAFWSATRLIAPDMHASFVAQFCEPGMVTFELGLNKTAILLTMAGPLIPDADILPFLPADRLIEFAAALSRIPLMESAYEHVDNALEAASENNRRTAFQELRLASQDMIRLARNREQRNQVVRALVDLGITVTPQDVLKMLAPAAAYTFRVFADFIVFDIQTGLGAKQIVIKLVAN